MTRIDTHAAPIYLGVDCGTESIRLLAVDSRGEVLATARVLHATSFPHPGWAEQSPTDWWRGFVQACHQLTSSGFSLHTVEAIGVTATSSTVVFADSAGEPLRPAMLWMDVRAIDQASALTRTAHAALDVCPDGVSPEWGPAKVAWVAAHEPDVFQRTDVVCEGGDWLIHQLTGVWSANIPAATTAWFYDDERDEWPFGLLAACGLNDLLPKLPDSVLRPGEIAGSLLPEVSASTGLREGIPVVEGGIDSISAMLAMGVTKPGETALITGSSNVILTQSAERIRGAGYWGGYRGAAIAGLDLIVGLHNAGSALAWLTRDLLHIFETTELEQEARQIEPGSDGLIALPDLQGNRTPFTEPRARGAFWGLTFGHRPAHLYRAMIEGMGFATRQAMDAFTATGIEFGELRVCGGASNSELTMQIYADILGRDLVTTGSADASALGAAMSAAIGAGRYPDFTAASEAMARPGRRYKPIDANRERYDEHYQFFRETYPALLPLMRRMAERNER